MTEPNSPPEVWGNASTAWSDEFHAIRVLQCLSLPHLRAAAKAEAESHARKERIKRINERVEQVKP